MENINEIKTILKKVWNGNLLMVDYCLKTESCRFKFSQKLRSHSTILCSEISYTIMIDELIVIVPR